MCVTECVYVCVYVHPCVCVTVCDCVCVCVCVCVCECVCVYVHAQCCPTLVTKCQNCVMCGSNVDCKWRITSKTGTIRITLLAVSIAQEMHQCEPYDFLIIYDGETQTSFVLCSVWTPAYCPLTGNLVHLNSFKAFRI